jgi:hypothetical protein
MLQCVPQPPFPQQLQLLSPSSAGWTTGFALAINPNHQKERKKEGGEEPFPKSTQVQLGKLPGNMTEDHIMETLPPLGK